MSILLSDDKVILCKVYTDPKMERRRIYRLGIINAIKYLEEPCDNAWHWSDLGWHWHDSITNGKYHKIIKAEHRYLCPKCMTEIKKEVGV